MKKDIPARFGIFNESSVKELTIAVKIDGVSTILSNRKLYTRAQYGMPGLVYGQPGLIYGGLLEFSDFLDNLQLNGSTLSLDQSIDPEEGRGTISQISLQFVDLNGFMTNLCSPGKVVPDLMGRDVEVFVGFAGISWPEDFVRSFRGCVSNISDQSGKVTLTLSDPNIKAKQELLILGATLTTAAIDVDDTEVPVDSTSSFNRYKISTNKYFSLVDSTVILYFRIGDEWFYRDPGLVGGLWPLADDKLKYFIRAQRGSIAEAHDIDSEVSEAVEMSGHPLDLALKLMLSGTDGPFASDIPVIGFNQTGDPELGVQANTIIMPKGVNVVREYGLVAGDKIEIDGGINNGRLCFISGFRSLDGQPNRIIDVTPGFTGDGISDETASAATISFTSQFNTLPFGMGLSPKDVEVERFIYLRDTFLLQAEYLMRFFITEDISNGKDFIESQLYKPIGAYSLTRGGKLSIGLTKPPLANADLRILSAENILDPSEIQVTRGLSGRKFFNYVYYNYDYNDEGNPTNLLRVADLESHDVIGIKSILRIEAKGARSDLQVGEVFQRRAAAILERYRSGAVAITVKVLFQEGILIEAGDIVGVRDDNILKLPNIDTGERDLGFRLFEVVRRSLDLKSGRATLVLSAGVAGGANDRYGVVSPSSVVDVDSTMTKVVLKASAYEAFGEVERGKWSEHIGERLLIHSEDWSVFGECTLEGFDQFDPRAITVSGLGFVPGEDSIVDIAPYPTSEDKNEAREYKELYAFLSPTVYVASAVDPLGFTVEAGKGSLFKAGATVRVHNYDYSLDSGEVEVLSVAGDVIETDGLGFTPDSDSIVDFIGFPDGGPAYRLI